MKVDSKDISGEFSSILANPAIATDVTCKLFLHKELYVNEHAILTTLISFIKYYIFYYMQAVL